MADCHFMLSFGARETHNNHRVHTMNIAILDDYLRVVPTLDCFAKLRGHTANVYHDRVADVVALAQRLAGAEALVLTRERTRITAELLARLPLLKIISQTGGIPHIDLAACTARGVAVATGDAGPSTPTAELTWGLAIAALRRIPQEMAGLRAGRWQSSLGLGLRGRTLGVIGYGKIGKTVAGYGKAFEMRVQVWGRETTLERARQDGYQTAPDKETLFAQSDVLTLHVTLTPETRGMVRRADLALMKPTALFINTSRAGLIEPGALVDALRAGRPGAAAVDVYDEEPLLDTAHPLLNMDGVICTPHLGYVERGRFEIMYGVAFDQINAFAAGQPRNVLNPEALTRR